MVEIELLVEGGNAKPGPALGQKLGPLGVNMGQVIGLINQKTKQFAGMKVPVKLIIDENKNIEVEVGLPPTSQLIKKEAGIEKGASNQKEWVGNISMEKIKEIAKLKMEEMGVEDLNKAIKCVIGTCISMGVKIDGKDPREVLKEL